MSDKKKLPLISKSLMTEILPVPSSDAGTASGPRERVRARMRELLERGTALAAVAGLAVGCSSPYNVVDPLPPPAGTGSGGKGGTGGKQPFPELCPQPNALAINISSARWEQKSVLLELEVQNVSAQMIKPQLKGATAAASIQVAIPSDSQISVKSDQSWPSSVEVSLSFVCTDGERNAAYIVRVQLDTSEPADSGPVRFQVL